MFYQHAWKIGILFALATVVSAAGSQQDERTVITLPLKVKSKPIRHPAPDLTTPVVPATPLAPTALAVLPSALDEIGRPSNTGSYEKKIVIPQKKEVSRSKQEAPVLPLFPSAKKMLPLSESKTELLPELKVSKPLKSPKYLKKSPRKSSRPIIVLPVGVREQAQVILVRLVHEAGLTQLNRPAVVAYSLANEPYDAKGKNSTILWLNAANTDNEQAYWQQIEQQVREQNAAFLFFIGRLDSASAMATFPTPDSHHTLAWSLFLPMVSSKVVPGDTAEKIAHVHEQVDQATLRFSREVEEGHLAIMGAFFDKNNQFGRGKGRLLLVNLNGETKEKTIAQLLARRQFFQYAFMQVDQAPQNK